MLHKFLFTTFFLITTLFSQDLSKTSNSDVSIIVLGTVQDAGSPHIACKKSCCAALFEKPDPRRMVVSLGLIDRINKKSYLFEATPDMPRQLKMLKNAAGFKASETSDGIFLTHAHIGHYSGLMYLGKEATNAKGVVVYAMPRMQNYLRTNGPWSQLVSTTNIKLTALENRKDITLSAKISVTPFTLPHRDEYSETVGYRISGPSKKALFIPDIDKWEKWERNIVDEIKRVDYAFLDATFYDGAEINNRDIKEIPHPFIIESMETFKSLSAAEKKKIYFIHFNHTNPALNTKSKKAKEIISNGFNIAQVGDFLDL
jgi:pyrroloquinoline quinone biosynthesis protein B